MMLRWQVGGDVVPVFGCCAERRSVQLLGAGRRLRGCDEQPSLNMESNIAMGEGFSPKKRILVRV